MTDCCVLVSVLLAMCMNASWKCVFVLCVCRGGRAQGEQTYPFESEAVELILTSRSN